MEFKKPNKEDMPIVVITAIIVIVMMISSAISPTEETGEPLTFIQWFIVNFFIIGIAIVIDIIIINNREKKKKYLIERRNKEEIEKERKEKEMTIEVYIKSGAIKKQGICKIHQLFENNLFYFDDEIETLYEMVGYEWDGARYKKVTKSDAQEIETGRKKASGLAAEGYGVVGAIGKTDSVSNRKSNGEVTEIEVEEQGSAIMRMKRVYDEKIFSFVIVCDSEIDKMIRCFNNIPE